MNLQFILGGGIFIFQSSVPSDFLAHDIWATFCTLGFQIISKQHFIFPLISLGLLPIAIYLYLWQSFSVLMCGGFFLYPRVGEKIHNGLIAIRPWQLCIPLQFFFMQPCTPVTPPLSLYLFFFSSGFPFSTKGAEGLNNTKKFQFRLKLNTIQTIELDLTWSLVYWTKGVEVIFSNTPLKEISIMGSKPGLKMNTIQNNYIKLDYWWTGGVQRHKEIQFILFHFLLLWSQGL